MNPENAVRHEAREGREGFLRGRGRIHPSTWFSFACFVFFVVQMRKSG